MKKRGGKGKKSQVALYVILALIIIAAGVAGYFLLKPKAKPKYPGSIIAIENSYVECLSNIVKKAKDIAMQKGGYIYDIPDEPEGIYIGNNLEFMGEKIPYWLYYDINGNVVEQKPNLKDIEKEIEKFILDNVENCDEVLKQYNISYEKKINRIDVKIKDDGIEVIAYIDLKLIEFGQSYLIKEHKLFIKSNLKKLYKNAEKIYEYEKQSRFLENYTFDIIALYGYTTGFELQCLPLIFNKEEIKENLVDGLTVNLERIKFAGNYYKLNKEVNKYFINNPEIDNGIFVNALYSKIFPTKIEIYGNNGELLKFDPIGNQPGLNVIGLCYVPYHLVYDVKYPILFTLSDGNEIFKFPIVVVIERNGVKEIIEENETIKTKEICNRAITNAKIFVYSNDAIPLDADIYFNCLDTTCYLGKTKDGYLETKVPECLNAFIIANTKSYAQGSLQTNTNYDFVANIFLNKLYEKEIILDLKEDEDAIITFDGPTNYAIDYKENNKVNLSEGNYSISVYVFKEKEITINKEGEICYDVSVFLSLTRKECQKIEPISFDKVVIGGGKINYYFDENKLKEGKIKIYFERFDEPESIEGVEKNYELVELSKLNIVVE